MEGAETPLKVSEVVELLQAEVVTGHSLLETNIEHALGADLMSDVLTTPRDETILLTGLTNLQVIRTAEMVDIRAIVLVRGKRPAEDTLRLAIEMNTPLLLTAYSLFETCGILYQAGLKA